MENRIYEMKDKLLLKIEEEMQDMDRIDVKEVGELINAVHHLAETEYYCSIADAMWMEKHGIGNTSQTLSKVRHDYTRRYIPNANAYKREDNYMPVDQKGVQANGEDGDVVEKLRAKLQHSNPDDRENLRREVSRMMGLL